MHLKNIKVRRTLITIAATILVITQMCGCAKAANNSIMDALTSGADITIKLQKPDYVVKQIGEPVELQYKRLDSQNEEYTAKFREEFDSIFGVKTVGFNEYNSLNGCMYINKNNEQDGNASLMDALRNKVFMEKYLANEYTHEKLEQPVDKLYADVDSETDNIVIAAINAYWNLTPDGIYEENAYFNGSKSLTRTEFNELIYRVHSPLDSKYDKTYEHANWLNKENGSLRDENINTSISRAEAIYTLMNLYFSTETRNVDATNSSLSDCKNAGTLLEDTMSKKKLSDALYTVDKDTEQMIIANGWQLGALSKMMRDTTGGVQVDIYKALVMANKLGIIEAETRYNEPLSKEEAIELIIRTIHAVNERDGYITESEYGDVSIFEKASKNEEITEEMEQPVIESDEDKIIDEENQLDNTEVTEEIEVDASENETDTEKIEVESSSLVESDDSTEDSNTDAEKTVEENKTETESSN